MEFTGKLHAQLERLQWLVSSLLKLSNWMPGQSFKREGWQRPACWKRLRTALDPHGAQGVVSAGGLPHLDLVCDLIGPSRPWSIS